MMFGKKLNANGFYFYSCCDDLRYTATQLYNIQWRAAHVP